MLEHTSLVDCPILDGSARVQFTSATRAANDFSMAVLEFLKKKRPEERAAWLRTSVDLGRRLFEPWSLEILYVLAALDRARFSQLLGLLGLSSRTLSDKLKALCEADLVQRDVFDEHPVRIEYFLTKHGRKTASLSSVLFAHLNHEALLAAGKLKA